MMQMPPIIKAVPLERTPPCQQFIGHYCERVLIGCGYSLALPLLGGHVSRGAANGLALAGFQHVACNTKIHQLQIQLTRMLCITLDKEIGGFHILVYDLAVMCMLEGKSRL